MTFLFVIHFIIAIVLVILVLIQKNEGGAALLSGGAERAMRGSQASATKSITRLTMFLGILFFSSSLLIATLKVYKEKENFSISKKLDNFEKTKNKNKAPSVPIK